MAGLKKSIVVIVALILMASIQAFSQQLDKPDPGQFKLRPSVHYTVGSSVTFIPHLGTFTGFTISPALSLPLNPKLTLEGGIIAGNYYSSFRGFNTEGAMNGSFTNLSLYGSALYHVTPQLTVYGSGFKQLTNSYPYSYFPKSYYSIGTTYNFGHFSIGATIQTTTWDNYFAPVPMNGPGRIYSPY